MNRMSTSRYVESEIEKALAIVNPSDPYDEGYIARRAGRTWFDCPYRPYIRGLNMTVSNPDYERWMAGFKACSRELEALRRRECHDDV